MTTPTSTPAEAGPPRLALLASRLTSPLAAALAALAVTTGALAALGMGSWVTWAAPAYLGLGLAVLRWPAALTVQVPVGALLAAGTVVAPGGRAGALGRAGDSGLAGGDSPAVADGLIGGLAAAANALLPGSGHILLLAPVVLGILLTAELLLMARRRSTRLRHLAPPQWMVPAGACLLAVGVFLVVAIAGSGIQAVTGPVAGPGTGLLPSPWDVVLAAAAVTLAGVWLTRRG